MDGDVATRSGGFQNLFDWQRKPRRRLFVDDAPGVEVVSRNVDSFASLSSHQIDGKNIEHVVPMSCIKEASGRSCASLVSKALKDGTRTPGVIARLMGLDSLPSPVFSEPCSPKPIELQSMKNAQSTNIDIFNQATDVLKSVDAYPIKLAEQTLQKQPGAVEIFQTNVISSISNCSPILQNSLLFPVRSRRVMPLQDVASAMEASALIPGAEHQANGRSVSQPGQSTIISSRPDGSQEGSSGSGKIQRFNKQFQYQYQTQADSLDNHLENVASQECIVSSKKIQRTPELSRKQCKSHPKVRPDGDPIKTKLSCSEGNTNAKKVTTNISSNYGLGLGMKEKTVSLAIQPKINLKKHTNINDDYGLGSGMKEKSVSLAIQAKINVKKREALLVHGRTQVETCQDDPRNFSTPSSSLLIKYQASSTNNSAKNKATLISTRVFKDNIQKQNCFINSSKQPVNGKLKYLDLYGTEVLSQNSHPLGVSNTFPKTHEKFKNIVTKHKRGRDVVDVENEASLKTGDLPKKNQLVDADYYYLDKDELIDVSTAESDHHIHSHISMDIVPFTFSTQNVKQTKEPEPTKSINASEKDSCSCSHAMCDLCDNKEKNISFSLDDIKGDALSILLDKKLQDLSLELGVTLSDFNLLEDVLSPTASSSELPLLPEDRALEIPEEEAGFSYKTYHSNDTDNNCSSGTSEFDKQVTNTRQGHEGESILKCSHGRSEEHDCPCSVFSIPESSFPDECCISLDSCRDYRKFRHECDGLISCKHEADYLDQILSTVNVHMKNFIISSMGWSLNTFLFDLLEFKANTSSKTKENKIGRLRRRVLFDCIKECLDNKCSLYFGVGYQSWTKGVAAIREGEFVKEIYKEILGWDRMADWMVDELVNEDMSSKVGRWLNFEISAFEMGIEIQSEILCRLLDEVIAEVLT